MTAARKWGYRQTPQNHHRPPYSLLASRMRSKLAAAPLPKEFLLHEHVQTPPFFDQGDEGSCVGHARARGITIALASIGTPLGYIASPWWCYTLPRCIWRAMLTPRGINLPKLTDDGTFPSLAHIGVSEWGIIPMLEIVAGRFSDCGPDNVCAEPDFDELKKSAEALIVGEYAIDGTEAQRGLAVRECIASARCPVEIGGMVDSRIFDWPAGQAYEVEDFFDPDGGGHDMIITGYTTLASGEVWYLVDNSWSEDYCEGGRLWVTERFLASATDLNALTGRKAS